MNDMNSTCRGMVSKLADVLLDPSTVNAEVLHHFDKCGDCRAELNSLHATMNALDTWQAPEPTPYFLTRLEARMREERQAKPEGWLARLRDRLTYGQSMHARPIAAMAMTVVLLLGGGAYLNYSNVWTSASTPAQSSQTAVVHDLQVLDNNAQLLDSLEAISGDNGSDSN